MVASQSMRSGTDVQQREREALFVAQRKKHDLMDSWQLMNTAQEEDEIQLVDVETDERKTIRRRRRNHEEGEAEKAELISVKNLLSSSIRGFDDEFVLVKDDDDDDDDDNDDDDDAQIGVVNSNDNNDDNSDNDDNEEEQDNMFVNVPSQKSFSFDELISLEAAIRMDPEASVVLMPIGAEDGKPTGDEIQLSREDASKVLLSIAASKRSPNVELDNRSAATELELREEIAKGDSSSTSSSTTTSSTSSTTSIEQTSNATNNDAQLRIAQTIASLEAKAAEPVLILITIDYYSNTNKIIQIQ